ncbi:Sec-independent protein translocase subunit TatA [Kitasatospora sp. NBC_01287]|uniref:Sec-independent protein translocase subunit TatA n=1 Tax=Kitasatospora sp. NBC_01287 TaxID=2903573 RepID=UPI002B1D802E|nr:Sec-independent protein translocase subunit TatA [Kitasatospora sp. NBC_01287]
MEIIIIGLVVLVLFGAKRLPDSARALGKSLRILKAEANALKTDGVDAAAAPAPAPGQRVEASALEGEIVEPAAARAAEPRRATV